MQMYQKFLLLLVGAVTLMIRALEIVMGIQHLLIQPQLVMLKEKQKRLKIFELEI